MANFLEDRASCFTLTVFLTACDRKCSVALTHRAVGWSALCDVVFLERTHLFSVMLFKLLTYENVLAKSIGCENIYTIRRSIGNISIQISK